MVPCSRCYLDWGLVQMTQVRCGLSGFMTQNHHVGVDQSEGINNNLWKHMKPVYWPVLYFCYSLWIHNESMILCSAAATHLYLSLDALNGINHNSNSSLWQGLKALLCVDVHARQPTAKPRVTVVPSHHHLWSKGRHKGRKTANGFQDICERPNLTRGINARLQVLPAGLFQHVQHLGLENRIHCFNTHTLWG